MALNAAAIDTRIKATVASTMYDMTRVTANGYFDAENNEEARYAKRKALNAQRTEDYKKGSYALAGGLPDELPADAPFFVKITTIITRRAAAIIPVRSIPTAAGTSRRPCRS